MGKQESIEYAEGLYDFSDNPFQTEIRLYDKEREPGDVLVTVVVPDFYHVAFPNIGHQMIEHQINKKPGFFADRAYLASDYSLLKEHPECKPEVIVISMSYEGSYIRALRQLDLMGVPLRREERTEGDPLVVIGGWSVSRNPLPLFDFADIIGVGAGEHIIDDIFHAYRERRGSRNAIADALVEKEGIIIPSRYHVKTENGYLAHWESHNAPVDIYPATSLQFPHSWYLSGETDYNAIGYYQGKTFFSMELVDACASKCNFCASGYRNKNQDIQDPNVVIELARWARQHGADLTKLFFPANSSVPATKEIMRRLIELELYPRVGSAKAEYIDREYLELVGRSGQEKIAFAPETGDYAHRRALGKPGMTNEVLKNVIVTSIECGIPNLDFYFIMNLPGEADNGLQQTIDLLGEFHALATSKGFKGRMRMSMPNFFPKASTTFQYAASGDPNTYSERIATLEQGVGDAIKVSSMVGSVDLLSQNIMSRGGVEVGALMIEVYDMLKQHERAQGVFSPDTIEDWRRAMTSLGLTEEEYISEKTTDRPLPWHHIHMVNIPTPTLVKAWNVFRAKRGMMVVDI